MNTSDLLIFDDLPCSIKLFENDVSIRFLNLLTSQASLLVGHAFLRNSVPSNGYVAVFFFMSGLTIVIIQKNQFWKVFESHSRDERGPLVPNGSLLNLLTANVPII